MARPHIAILISALGPGGAERVIALLAQHWVDQGHRLTVIAFDHEGDQIYHDLPEHVATVRLGSPNGGVVGNIRKIARLRSALKEKRPEVLLSFLTKNNLLAAAATASLPVRWVACERNNPERQSTHPLWNSLLAYAYRKADGIVCQTHGVTRCFPEAAQDRIVVIPNPIALAKRHRTQGFGKRIAAVGRLDRQKGFDRLIDAFAMVAPDYPEWTLDIWGSGPERDSLALQISKSGLDERITLRGTSSSPRAWIDETDLFVLSSRYEGFPNVLGEALSAGLPVVATDCDFGPSDMITHGEDGWLVPRGDAAGLADGLNTLLFDEQLRTKLASNAARSAKRFAPSVVMPKWDQIVERVTSGSASSDLRNGAHPKAEPAE